MSQEYQEIGFVIDYPKLHVSDVLSDKRPKQDEIESYIYLDAYLEEIENVSECIFVNKKHPYQKNMVLSFLMKSLDDLKKAKDSLNEELYDIVYRHLYLLYQIISSNGWKNNKIISEEAKYLNYLSENFFEFTPSIIHMVNDDNMFAKKLSFTEDEDGVRTTEKYNVSEYKKFLPILLAVDKTLTEKERLECSINTLAKFVESIKVTKSFKNENVDYMKGETDAGIHEEVINLSHSVVRTLTYTINSTSWLKNELLSFDRYDITRKIESFILLPENLYV